MTKKKELTELQKAFLAHLVGDAKGSFVRAKEMAGYSPNTPVREIIGALREEIMDACKDILVRGAPEAAFELVNQISDPSKNGASISARAAQEVLDRVGLTKPSGTDINLKVPESGLVILPAKQVPPHMIPGHDEPKD